MLHITEVLGHRKTGLRHTHSGTRCLIHLSEDEGRVLDDTTRGHLAVEIITLTGTLTYTGENRVSAMLGRDVSDQLLNQDRLTDTCTTEQTDLTTLCVRCQQIDDLDTGLENLLYRILVLELRRLPVDLPVLLCLRCRLSIDRIAQHIKQSAEGLLTYRNSDSGTCIRDDHVPLESLGCTQHDAAHDALPHLLCHLHDTLSAMIIYLKCSLDLRKRCGIKRHIDDRSHHLHDFSCLHVSS